MAWGYWTAHSLSARTSRPRSLSPAPGSVVRSRDHSLDRPSIETECGGHPNHVSYHDHSDHHHDHSDHDHHRDSSEWSERNEDRNEDRNHRTKVRDRDRNTLPRVKMELDYVDGRGGGGGGTVMVEQRHTLPRGRTEPESQGWPESAGLPQSQGKASSEGEGWCPGCPVSNVSSCRSVSVIPPSLPPFCPPSLTSVLPPSLLSSTKRICQNIQYIHGPVSQVF